MITNLIVSIGCSFSVLSDAWDKLDKIRNIDDTSRMNCVFSKLFEVCFGVKVFADIQQQHSSPSLLNSSSRSTLLFALNPTINMMSKVRQCHPPLLMQIIAKSSKHSYFSFRTRSGLWQWEEANPSVQRLWGYFIIGQWWRGRHCRFIPFQLLHQHSIAIGYWFQIRKQKRIQCRTSWSVGVISGIIFTPRSHGPHQRPHLDIWLHPQRFRGCNEKQTIPQSNKQSDKEYHFDETNEAHNEVSYQKRKKHSGSFDHKHQEMIQYGNVNGWEM